MGTTREPLASAAIETSLPEVDCDLLYQLKLDLVSRIRAAGFSEVEAVAQIADELVTSYSREICRERLRLQDLRHLHSELQSAVYRKEQFIAHILEESADAILTVDSDQAVVIWNRGAEAIFGFRQEEIVGKPITLLVPVSRRDELLQIETETRRCGAVNNRIAQWLTKEGNPLQVILTSTAIRGGSGNYLGSSFVIKDVTRQREMEEGVRQAEHIASIGQLATGLAHEIKNPLAGIQGAIDVIKEHSSIEFERSILSEVSSQVRRIDRIVRDLLNYAKPKTPELKSLCLATLLTGLIHLLQESSGREVHFALEREQEEAEAKVLGDQSSLEQVFINLLLNSIEATNGRGEIRICLRSDLNTLTVSIEDSGPGVPIALHNRIFDPFFTTKKSGTGLGLAIARRIIHEHGGTLALDPDVEQGAAFVLKLPCEGEKEHEI
jgi:PAS domain S-box-containing protein